MTHTLVSSLTRSFGMPHPPRAAHGGQLWQPAGHRRCSGGHAPKPASPRACGLAASAFSCQVLQVRLQASSPLSWDPCPTQRLASLEDSAGTWPIFPRPERRHAAPRGWIQKGAPKTTPAEPRSEPARSAPHQPGAGSAPNSCWGNSAPAEPLQLCDREAVHEGRKSPLPNGVLEKS